jgi:hypothetical protein
MKLIRLEEGLLPLAALRAAPSVSCHWRAAGAAGLSHYFRRKNRPFSRRRRQITRLAGAFTPAAWPVRLEVIMRFTPSATLVAAALPGADRPYGAAVCQPALVHRTARALSQNLEEGSSEIASHGCGSIIWTAASTVLEGRVDGAVRKHGLTHRCVDLSSGVRVKGTVHVQNVNGYHSRLRGWLHHFRGVATRYLANYCGWRWAIDCQRVDNPEALLRWTVGVFTSRR